MKHLEHENSCTGLDQKSICLVADANGKTASKMTCVVCSFPSFKDASSKVGLQGLEPKMVSLSLIVMGGIFFLISIYSVF